MEVIDEKWTDLRAHQIDFEGDSVEPRQVKRDVLQAACNVDLGLDYFKRLV